MDPKTEAIRAQYEAFPYPATAAPEIRVGGDVRLLLSYGRLPRPAGRQPHCLDAGCGRGNGALGAAATQPDVRFTAVDINRVALADAAARAREMGLENIRFQEVDLMTLKGLEIPDGGFDAIVSSGVLHHLASPDEGLRQLRQVLAPHGILTLMVYGTLGREPLYRMVRAVDLLVPRDRPLAERLAVARHLAAEARGEALRVGPIGLSERLHPNEFVDRYLNVNETSYDVATLFALLERNGFHFLRWTEPGDWILGDGPAGVPGWAEHLSDLQRYQLVEQISWRHQLSLIACAGENAARELPPAGEWDGMMFALNPEVTLQFEVRTLQRSRRVEKLSYQLRKRPQVQLTGPMASLLWTLKDETTPIAGRELRRWLEQRPMSAQDARQVLTELVEREILYSPHPVDC
jgi:SAM-dependent methyltransferase